MLAARKHIPSPEEQNPSYFDQVRTNNSRSALSYVDEQDQRAASLLWLVAPLDQAEKYD